MWYVGVEAVDSNKWTFSPASVARSPATSSPAPTMPPLTNRSTQRRFSPPGPIAMAPIIPLDPTMRTRRTVRRSLALLATLAPALAAQHPDYAKAERMLTWNTAPLVANDILSVTWLADSTRFWYRVSRPTGYEFILVDPVANTTRPLFDHLRLASALTRMETRTRVVRGNEAPLLPFTLLGGERTLRFKSGDRYIECDLTRYECAPSSYKARPASEVPSPDSQWVAYVKDHNIWVKRASGGDETPLTTDGARFNGYGTGEPRPSQVRSKEPIAPSIVWSPDGKQLLVVRTDERGVEMFPLYSSTTIRPSSYLMPYALPGDTAYERATRYVIDVATKTARAVTPPAIYSAGFGGFAGIRGGGEWRATRRASSMAT